VGCGPNSQEGGEKKSKLRIDTTHQGGSLFPKEHRPTLVAGAQPTSPNFGGTNYKGAWLPVKYPLQKKKKYTPKSQVVGVKVI